MDILTLVSQFLSLAGFGALIAVLVNVCKSLGWIQDGQAPTIVTGLNILGVAALLALKVFLPGQDVSQLDSVAASVAQILVLVFGLIVQIGGSKLAHLALRGTPLIGKSFSLGK